MKVYDKHYKELEVTVYTKEEEREEPRRKSGFMAKVLRNFKPESPPKHLAPKGYNLSDSTIP